MYAYIDRLIERGMCIQTDRRMDLYVYKQTDRLYIETDRWTDIDTYIYRQTEMSVCVYTHTDRHTDTISTYMPTDR